MGLDSFELEMFFCIEGSALTSLLLKVGKEKLESEKNISVIINHGVFLEFLFSMVWLLSPV